jgi:uncharacterized membrane protein
MVERLEAVSNVQPLSPNLPPNSFLTGFLPVIIVFAILIIVAVSLALKKQLKKIAIATLIVVIVIAAVATVWSVEASIDYWFVSPYTSATKDNFLTMNCQNTGRLSGTFDLVIDFVNAHVSLKTSLPYQLIDNQTAKFTFVLQPGEKQSREVWFIINENVSDFYINLSFQLKDGNFFVKSSPGGVDSASYQKDSNDGNFTLRTFVPPP